MDELAKFAAKWSLPDGIAEPVAPAALDEVEVALRTLLPMDYRIQVLEVGLPTPTLALLSAVSDRWWLGINDLAQLHNPTGIIENTLGWRKAGLSEQLVAIGSDSLGNQFCFPIVDNPTGRPYSLPVYFWDHDFRESEKIADSFAIWIASYLGVWSDGISAEDF